MVLFGWQRPATHSMENFLHTPLLLLLPACPLLGRQHACMFIVACGDVSA